LKDQGLDGRMGLGGSKEDSLRGCAADARGPGYGGAEHSGSGGSELVSLGIHIAVRVKGVGWEVDWTGLG
jgi:hypothetical protein